MTASMIKLLQENRQKVWHQTKELLDAAAAEGRDLDAAEEARYQALNGDLDTMRDRISEIQERTNADEAAQRSIDEILRKQEVVDHGSDDEESQDAILRSFLRGERKHLELFAPERRDLVKVTPAAGGSLQQVTLYDQIIEHFVEVSGVQLLGPTELVTSTGEEIDVPQTTSYGTAAQVAEGTAIPESDPAFGKSTLRAYKYGRLNQASIELINDTKFDILGFIARVAGQAVGQAFAEKLVTGSGVNEPAGVATSAVVGKTGLGTAPTADDLIDLFYSVIGPYRNSTSAGWLLSDATMSNVRKLKDGDGRYLFTPALGLPGAVDTILSKKVASDPYVAAAAASAKSVLFGDFSTYFVRRVGAVRFEQSSEYAFNTDMVTFKTVIRADGLQADKTGAIKAFVGKP